MIDPKDQDVLLALRAELEAAQRTIQEIQHRNPAITHDQKVAHAYLDHAMGHAHKARAYLMLPTAIGLLETEKVTAAVASE